MTPAETIQPAMTPEEWERAREFPDIENSPGDRDAEMAESIRPYLNGPDRPRLHAVAALALHGQPFGFTRVDIQALRGAAHVVMDTDHAARLLAPTVTRDVVVAKCASVR